MKTMSKSVRILIVLACVVTIIAMIFVATKANLAPVLQSYVCEFCTDNALSPHPQIGKLLDNTFVNTCTACKP